MWKGKGIFRQKIRTAIQNKKFVHLTLRITRFIFMGCAVSAKQVRKNNQILIFNEKVDVLLGLQWDDEGKGKVVDVLHRDMAW